MPDFLRFHKSGTGCTDIKARFLPVIRQNNIIIPRFQAQSARIACNGSTLSLTLIDKKIPPDVAGFSIQTVSLDKWHAGFFNQQHLRLVPQDCPKSTKLSWLRGNFLRHLAARLIPAIHIVTELHDAVIRPSRDVHPINRDIWRQTDGFLFA